jgi:hypothetical protein
MKLNRILAGLAVLALLTPLAGFAAGTFQTLPGIGASSYCAAFVTGTTGQICAQTIPAGPTLFLGSELAPMDIYAPGVTSSLGGAQTAFVNINQLGQGPIIDQTTVATAQTIPNSTPWYFLDGAQAAAFTVTMPAVAIEGQIVRIVCESATAGVLTVAGNTGQTVKNNPAAACVVGTTYSFRYVAASATWFRF